MRIGFGLVVVTLCIAFAGAAVGQDDPIKARQQIMKENGGAARAAFQMASGKNPYDATAAAEAMNGIAARMEVFPTLFAEGSDQGDTSASPEIWKNMDDFKALAAKLATDAKAAAEAAPNGLDAFKVAFDAVNADCSACHKKYRTD